MSDAVTKFLFGRLTLEAIPYHEPILLGTFAMVVLGGIVVVGALSYYKLWNYLWREWFTTVDHKRIGIMYLVLGTVMLLPSTAVTAICPRIIMIRCSPRTA